MITMVHEIVEELVNGSIGSPLKGISFTHTSALTLTDKSALVLSNLNITKQDDGDGTYTLVATGTLTDATALTGNSRIELTFTNVTNGEGSDFNKTQVLLMVQVISVSLGVG